MTLTPGIRKFGLTAHITFSIGWFGAIAAFLAMAVSGLVSQRPQMVTANYLSMELIGWYVIVPFCLAAFFTGVVQALVTEWGLIKHYWILVKLVLTIVATVLLFLHMQPVSYLADVASKSVLSPSELQGLRIRLVADAGVALFVLLVVITVSIYKPWGRISFTSQNNNTTSLRQGTKRRSWGLYVLLALIGLMLLIAILHVFGIGLKH